MFEFRDTDEEVLAEKYTEEECREIRDLFVFLALQAIANNPEIEEEMMEDIHELLDDDDEGYWSSYGQDMRLRPAAFYQVGDVRFIQCRRYFGKVGAKVGRFIRHNWEKVVFAAAAASAGVAIEIHASQEAQGSGYQDMFVPSRHYPPSPNPVTGQPLLPPSGSSGAQYPSLPPIAELPATSGNLPSNSQPERGVLPGQENPNSPSKPEVAPSPKPKASSIALPTLNVPSAVPSPPFFPSNPLDGIGGQSPFNPAEFVPLHPLPSPGNSEDIRPIPEQWMPDPLFGVMPAEPAFASIIPPRWKPEVRQEHKSGWDTVADPVDVVTGAFYVDEVDLALAGSFPFAIRRNYNSQNPFPGELGYGWKLSLCPYLMEHEDLRFAAEEDGSIIAYRFNPDSNRFEVTPEDNPTLFNDHVTNPFHSYMQDNVLYRADGSKRVFKGGLLQEWVDAAGQKLSFSYREGLLKEIRSSCESCTFSYDEQGRITGICSGKDKKIGYHYDSKGDLTTVTLPNQATIAYQYDGDHRLTQELKEGSAQLQNLYDGHGRVIAQQSPADQEGKMATTATFAYQEGETLVTDAEGYSTRYLIYQGQIYKIIDPLGCETLRSWYLHADHWLDPTTGQVRPVQEEGSFPHSLRQTTDKRGLITSYRYDGFGNLISLELHGQDLTGDGLQNITKKFRYNECHQLVAEEVAGRVTLTTYDAAFPYLPSAIETRCEGSLVSCSSFTYNAAGQLSREDRDGSIALWEYDRQGRPSKRIQLADTEDPDVVTSYFRGYHFSHQGGYISTSRPDGTQREAFDVMGNCVEESLSSPSRALLKEIQTSYNPANRPTSQKQGIAIASYEYFPSGQIKARHQILPEGRATTQYHYDLRGNLIEEIDPLGYSTFFEYDPRCQVIRTTKEGREAQFTYEGGGFVETIIDPLGGATTRRYTTNGLLKEEITVDGQVRPFTYDLFGRPLVEYRRGVAWEIGYDDPSLKVVYKHPETDVTEVEEFDRRGNLICLVDGEGFRWEKSYDGLSRLKGERDPSGNETRYFYEGDTTRTVRPSGEEKIDRYECGRLAESWVKSATGELLSHVEFTQDATRGEERWITADDETRITYNALNKLACREERKATTHYEYDLCGNCTAIIDGESRRTCFTYDAFGQPLTKELPDGTVISYSYDLAGNLTEMALPNRTFWRCSYDTTGKRVSEALWASGEQSQKREYAYQEGRLDQTIDPLGRLHSYQYDPYGRLSGESVDGWQRSYKYDARGLLISAEQYQGRPWLNWLWPSSTGSSRVERAYDESGRLIGETTVLGSRILHEVQQLWSPSSRTIRVGGHERVFRYEDGRITSLSTPECAISYRYSLGGSLLEKETPLAATSWDYHPSGLIKSIRVGDGSVYRQEGMAWDPAGRLSGYTRGEEALGLTYSARGMLSSIGDSRYEFDHGGCGTGVRTASPEAQVADGGLDRFGRVVSEISNSIAYDSAGQVISQGDRQVEWDPWGRLVKISGSDFTWEASYDAFGRRLETRASRGGALETVVSCYDPEEEFQEIGVTTDKGTSWRLHGPVTCDALIGEETVYPVYNAFGQLVGIQSEREEVVLDVPISPYGPRGPPLSGYPEIPAWHGKCLDPTGLIWLGARYYDPGTGRFLSADPVGYPACLDLYAYANGDPINFTDLDGRFASRAYEKVKATAVNTWYDPRFQGSLQMAGGALEAGIGAGLSLATCGWGSAVGFPVMAHGMDHVLTGARTAISGRPQSTITAHALQRTGMSAESAHLLDAGIGMVGTLGAASWSNAVRVTAFPVLRASSIATPVRTLGSEPGMMLRGDWVLPENGGGARINGRWYTEHALERMAPNTPRVMASLEARALERARVANLHPTTLEFGKWMYRNGPQPRGIPPIVVEAEIAYPNTTGVRVVLNQQGDVVTVIPN
ncbi:MAG: RHS repeat-associated core domain-containing protein [Candidatus Obscuribacterales bacterium]